VFNGKGNPLTECSLTLQVEDFIRISRSHLKILSPKGNTTKIPYKEPTNTGRHRTKLSPGRPCTRNLCILYYQPILYRV